MKMVLNLAALLVALVLAVPASAGQGASGTTERAVIRFVTLGTAGGPFERVGRAQPANALLVGEDIYLFDMGDGFLTQMAKAKLDIARVRAAFVSHHHIDHNGGLPVLLFNHWLMGKGEVLDVIGPPGTREMVTGLVGAFSPTVRSSQSLGPVPVRSLADSSRSRDMPADTDQPIIVYENDDIRVLAVVNTHLNFKSDAPERETERAYSFRIETPSGVFVYTGDTGPSVNLERLAQGADVLVTEIVDLVAARAVGKANGLPDPALESLMRHMREDHLVPAEIGKLGQKAGVKRIVLTHFAPGNAVANDIERYRNEISKYYSGRIEAATDLDEYSIGK